MALTDPFEALKSRFSDSDLSYLKTALSGPESFLTPALIEAAAHEVLAYAPHEAAQSVAARRGVILVRASSRLRALDGRPLGIDQGLSRNGRDASHVEVSAKRLPYSEFFGVEELDLTHTRFDGTPSERMTRAAFLMADAVTVLPYDPVRDRVLVVEQFRVGPYARGDQYPWTLEPIAGRIDAGEGPESTAHREAMEETGIELRELHEVGGYYPSPGAVTEYIYSYIGIADLPDDVEGVSGLESEHEDIASLLVPFDTALSLADAGAVDNGPLMLSIFWLARHRDSLRG